jgi:hypothetical protein
LLLVKPLSQRENLAEPQQQYRIYVRLVHEVDSFRLWLQLVPDLPFEVNFVEAY